MLQEYLRVKAILSLITLVSVHVLVWNGKISDTIYSAVVIATVAAFIAAEAFERVKSS